MMCRLWVVGCGWWVKCNAFVAFVSLGSRGNVIFRVLLESGVLFRYRIYRSVLWSFSKFRIKAKHPHHCQGNRS